LTGAQKGLVLSITPEGGIVHWSGARPSTSSSDPFCLVDMVELLPYHDGSTLPADNDHGSIEILNSVTTAESGTHSAPRHSREVFMAVNPPQIPMPQAPDIQEGEETLSNISPGPQHLTGRLTSRRRLGKGRKEHDRLVVTVPSIARKSGSGTRQPAEKLSGNAWLQKPSMSNANGIKKKNDNVETVMPSRYLPHATSTPTSWK